MKLSKKLKTIRQREGLTQVEFSKISGIALGTVKNYESGQQEPGIHVILQVTNNPKFEKYTVWLMTNKTALEEGQIGPIFEKDQKRGTIIEHKPETSPQQDKMHMIMYTIKNLKEEELDQLNKLISRKGSMFLLELLDKENQELIGLRGFRKFVALMLKNLDDQSVREILDTIERRTEEETHGISDMVQKSS